MVHQVVISLFNLLDMCLYSPPEFLFTSEFLFTPFHSTFFSRGFLHGHVSYISEDCQACLLLLTVQRDAFFPLSQAKHTIAEKLRRSNCLVAINDALNRKEELPTTNPLKHIGISEIRHFMYKCKSTAQLFTSDPISLDRLQDYRYGLRLLVVLLLV